MSMTASTQISKSGKSVSAGVGDEKQSAGPSSARGSSRKAAYPRTFLQQFTYRYLGRNWRGATGRLRP